MKAYLSRFRSSWRVLLAISLLASLNGVLPGVLVFFLKAALDALLAGGEGVEPPLLGLVVIASLSPFQHIGRAVLSRRLAWRLVHQLRMELHEALYAQAENGPVGDRLAALSHECDELQYGLSALITAVRSPLSVLVLSVSAVWLAPALALRVALAAPVVALVAWWGGRWVRTLTSTWRIARADLFAELTDQHNGWRTTLDHDAVAYQVQRAATLSSREAQARARLEWGKAVPGAVLQGGLVLLIAGLLWTGAGEVAEGNTTAGGLVAFAVALGLLRAPIVRSTEIWTLLSRSTSALERVWSLLNTRSTSKPDQGRGFQLHTEAIPGRLAALDLTLLPNTKVALIGASGSGKSTLLALLSGHLVLPGVRGERSVFCRQEPWIFNRSLMENLRLGAPVLRGDIEEVLEDVGLTSLRPRLEEMAGEQGSRLSGGERQRLALARALLRRERGLLLDEATSEVEPQLAKQLAKHLSELERTVVFATHEPWFPAVADRVLWLKEGRIFADGTHGELLISHPDYARLWKGEAS